MSFQNRLKNLRLNKKLTQQEVADKLGITRQAYGYYESVTSKREPDHSSTRILADLFGVTTDYLLGVEQTNTVTVAGQEINLSIEELQLFEELKKHPALFHDLATDPERKIKELLKLYEMKKMLLEEDTADYGDGFGELKD